MALETMKNVKQINGVEIKEVEWKQPEGNFIEVNHACNAITFKIQNGPVKENGINGCQVEDMIAVSKHIVSELQKKYPSKYNEDIILHLELAIQASKQRTADREARGVEGKSEK
jgi:hypothetical protein